MANLANLTILLLAASLLAASIEAADFTVGGDTGWTNSLPNAAFYSDWAANLTFSSNDTLVFNFAAGRHDVAILSTQADFDNCNVGTPIQLITTSPARVALNRTGEFYFACAFSGHCSVGQKLSVNVTSGSGSGESPSGSPPTPPAGEGAPTSPTEPGSTAPPPEGSANSLAATFSLLLTTIAVNFLF